MPVSSDSLRLAIVPEAVVGQLPPTPDFDLLRVTSENLAFNATTTVSNELGGEGRGSADLILTGGQNGGDIAFELHKEPGFETLLEAFQGNHWGANPASVSSLTGGDFLYTWDDMQTVAAEARWTQPDDSHTYQRYYGLTPNTLTLTITPNQPITGSFGFIGTTVESDDAEAAGASYTPAPATPVMTAPYVTAITLTDADGVVLDVNTYCFTSLTFNLNNNDRGISCIGYLGIKETVFGQLEGTIAYSVQYSNDFLLQAYLDQVELGLVVEMRDTPGNTYKWTFPRIKVQSCTIAAGGKNQEVPVTGNFVILKAATTGYYPLLIERGVPGPVTAGHTVAADQHSATITFSGGPSDADGTVNVTVTATGSTIAPVSVPFAEADDKYTIAKAVAKALNQTNLLATASRETVNLGIAGTTTLITAVTATIT